MKILSYLFVLVTFSSVAEVNRAWWVVYIYEPKSSSFLEYSASEIHRDIILIDIYTCNSMKYFTPDQCGEIKRNNAQFEIHGDFNKDGGGEVWNVGIAKFKNGNFAHTVIVRNKATNKIEQVLTVENKKPKFAILSEYKGSINLFFCMECGDFAKIVWNGNKWVLKWPEPYG